MAPSLTSGAASANVPVLPEHLSVPARTVILVAKRRGPKDRRSSVARVQLLLPAPFPLLL